MTHPDQVDYLSGKTRLFGIVGHPIEQVRSPEMVTAEMKRRGMDAILLPLHVLPDDFDTVLPQLLRLANLDGLVFTIPYKLRACALADEFGAEARVVGAINLLARGKDGRWRGDIFDGIGCVEAFRRRGLPLTGKRVQLLGAGGAGAAIAAAVAGERPAVLRIHDVDIARAQDIAHRVETAHPGVPVHAGEAKLDGIDVLINATPVGMLTDSRLPLAIKTLPSTLVVMDAIVKPERTPLLALAEDCGCTTVHGREMMRGQIARMVDAFAAG